MNIEYNCFKIQSSFKKDDICYPKKGKCRLVKSIQDNSVFLEIFFKPDKIYFDQNTEEFKNSSYKVC